jgi:hypothetical protein
MGMEQSTTIAHIFEGDLATESRLERILCKVVAREVCLKERRHLRVAWSRSIEDKEVNLEAKHVNRCWNDDEANGPCDEMLEVSPLWKPGAFQLR